MLATMLFTMRPLMVMLIGVGLSLLAIFPSCFGSISSYMLTVGYFFRICTQTYTSTLRYMYRIWTQAYTATAM